MVFNYLLAELLKARADTVIGTTQLVWRVVRYVKGDNGVCVCERASGECISRRICAWMMALHVIKTHWNQAAGNRAVLTSIHLRRAPGHWLDAHQPHINPSVQSINDSWLNCIIISVYMTHHLSSFGLNKKCWKWMYSIVTSWDRPRLPIACFLLALTWFLKYAITCLIHLNVLVLFAMPVSVNSLCNRFQTLCNVHTAFTMQPYQVKYLSADKKS